MPLAVGADWDLEAALRAAGEPFSSLGVQTNDPVLAPDIFIRTRPQRYGSPNRSIMYFWPVISLPTSPSHLQRYRRPIEKRCVLVRFRIDWEEMCDHLKLPWHGSKTMRTSFYFNPPAVLNKSPLLLLLCCVDYVRARSVDWRPGEFHGYGWGG